MFPSNCHLILMANCSFLMANCKSGWVKNSSLTVDYSFSMVSCKSGWVKNSSSTVDYNFWMVSYRNGLVRNFWMARMVRA